MYHNGEAIGVIGMDIDVEIIRELCANVKVYESGNAFLLDSEGNLVYGKRFPNGAESHESPSGFEMLEDNLFTIKYNGEESLIASQLLDNNMKFYIRVPTNEINEPKTRLIGLLLLYAGIHLLISVFVIFIGILEDTFTY